jgi:hypothetical protein
MGRLQDRIHTAGMIFLQTVLFANFSGGAELPEIVSKIPGDRREFKIAKTEFSNDQREARVTFASTTGIFAFDLELGAHKLSRLTLVIQDQSFCEGLTFRGKDGGETDLRTAKGVKVATVGRNIVIELSAAALETLRPGGRVQFVNQYR